MPPSTGKHACISWTGSHVRKRLALKDEVSKMIVRVWSCRCRRGKEEEFENFIRSELLPSLRQNGGCLNAIAAKDFAARQPKVLLVTVWRNLDSLRSFTGPQWRRRIVNPKAATFISGEPELEHFDLVEAK